MVYAFLVPFTYPRGLQSLIVYADDKVELAKKSYLSPRIYCAKIKSLHQAVQQSEETRCSPMLPIEVSNLKKYYDDVKAVDGISFTVSEGEVFGLLGPNGAGKTTAIEILEGLRKKDGGDTKVLGLDPWEEGYKLHRKIGVIPQGFTFLRKDKPAGSHNLLCKSLRHQNGSR